MQHTESTTAIERYAAGLAEAVESSGLSKSELARIAGRHRQTLATRLDNLGALTVTEMARLEKALNIDAAGLMRGAA